MKAADLRAKSQAELVEELQGLLKQQFKLRMQRGTGQLARPHELRIVRRDVARVKSVLNEKRAES